MRRILLSLLATLSLSASASLPYLDITSDVQKPDEEFIISRVFSGNTPLIRWTATDESVTNGVADLTGWSFVLWYARDNSATAGYAIVQQSATSNRVIFSSITNFFAVPNDYYVSILGTHTTGYVRTWGVGRMNQKWDFASGSPAGISPSQTSFNWNQFSTYSGTWPFRAGSNITLYTTSTSLTINATAAEPNVTNGINSVQTASGATGGVEFAANVLTVRFPTNTAGGGSGTLSGAYSTSSLLTLAVSGTNIVGGLSSAVATGGQWNAYVSTASAPASTYGNMRPIFAPSGTVSYVNYQQNAVNEMGHRVDLRSTNRTYAVLGLYADATGQSEWSGPVNSIELWNFNQTSTVPFFAGQGSAYLSLGLHNANLDRRTMLLYTKARGTNDWAHDLIFDVASPEHGFAATRMVITTEGNVIVSNTVRAGAFVGNGSGLTNLQGTLTVSTNAQPAFQIGSQAYFLNNTNAPGDLLFSTVGYELDMNGGDIDGVNDLQVFGLSAPVGSTNITASANILATSGGRQYISGFTVVGDGSRLTNLPIYISSGGTVAQTSTGAVLTITGGGGSASLSPWTNNVNAAGFTLTNALAIAWTNASMSVDSGGTNIVWTVGTNSFRLPIP